MSSSTGLSTGSSGPPLVSVPPNTESTSIRSSADVGAPLPSPGLEDDTFTQMISIHLDQPVGSMSISPSNRDVALGAGKGLFIIDLQNPYDPPRFLPHHSPWEPADVQWNPFPARSEWVASTSALNAVIYNLSFSPTFAVSPIEHTLKAHRRAVTDINWSPGSPEVLATCSLDGWVWSWDLRTGYGTKSGAGGGRKPVWGVCNWGSEATQVKWNRREPHVVASAHGSKVMIWDDRMGAAPVHEIHGHDAKIYGIDWSRKDPKRLITCSLDKSFKAWNLNDTTTSLLHVKTTSPIWRARYLPFGDGCLTLPQRNDHALSIWGRSKIEAGNSAEPVARFEGAREGVKEFVWRTRGGNDLESDDRQFQLVTWAKDRRLRLWPISDEITREVGHVRGAPIIVPMTRRGGPDISYRTFAETPAPAVPLSFFPSPQPVTRNLPPGASLLSASLSTHSSPPPPPSLLTSSLLAASFSTVPSPLSNIASASPLEPRRTAATMTTTRVRNRQQKAHDRLAWMEGVKVFKVPLVTVPDLDASNADSRGRVLGGAESATHTRSSSLQRGTDAGTAREGGETERAESVLSPGSTKTGTATGNDATYSTLGEEVTSVVRRFPRVNFEKVHVAGRTCTVSLYSPLFLRATFTFPKNYPHSSPPAIELERNADVTLKSRAFILQSVRRMMSSRAGRGLPSLELALRFLLGDRSSLDDKPLQEEDDDDDDDDVEEGLEGGVAGAVAPEILRNNFNVPPPRRGGAVFGPRGQLVVFFPTNVFITSAVEKDEPGTPAEPSMTKPKLVRLSEAFGTLHHSTVDVSLDDNEYQETDEALQITSAHSIRTSGIYNHKTSTSHTPVLASPSFSTLVHIKDVSHLTLMRPGRITCVLGGAPLDVARDALMGAIASQDLFLAKVWSTLVMFLESATGPPGAAPSRQLETLFADRLLPELLSFLVHLKDIQTLGVIACLLESYARTAREASIARPVSPTTPKTPGPVDYFSHRVPSSSRSSSQFDVQTPLATSGGYRTSRRPSEDASHSPKPSWTNLSSFFNSSVLSLRSGSPTTPGSPDRPLMSARSISLASSAGATGHQLSPSSPLPHLMSTSPARSPRRTLHQLPEVEGAIRPAQRRPQSRTRLKSSPNVTFGGTSVAFIGPGSNKATSSTSVSGVGGTAQKSGSSARGKRGVSIRVSESFATHKPVVWFLTESAQLELELLRLAYAELLYRWGLDHDRLQVLKLCRSSSKNHGAYGPGFGADLVKTGNGLGAMAAIDLIRDCSRCGATVSSDSKDGKAQCQTCHRRQQSTLCSLCHLPVETLSQTCTLCLHVGHLSCMSDWFKADGADCPTGCGCSCVASGGTSGIFLVPDKATGTPIMSRPQRTAWGTLRSPQFSLPFLT